MRAATAGLIIVATAATPFAASPHSTVKACQSSKDDDTSHEACFGWCSAMDAASHCEWCKCRGCGWCASFDEQEQLGSLGTGNTPSMLYGVSSSTSSSSAAGSICSSEAVDDVAYADCQPFCEPSQASTHCALCKCKSCHFCGCNSDFADDSNEKQCQSWCTADYYQDHCARCKCQGCAFCAQGPPCESSLADDISFEACHSFCSVDFAESHCGFCKCKGCGFCKAPQLTAATTCNSGIEGDVSREMCQAFCDPANRDDHCSLCKCRGCDFCTCTSGHANDTNVEMCQPWCSADQYDTHSTWCACKGCNWAKKGGKSCTSFFVTGDSDHEDCEPFCAEESASVHCGYCKCKRCGFCKAAAARQKAKEKAALSAPAEQSSAHGLVPEGATKCFSGLARDSLYEQCEGFCSESSREEHCKLCMLCCDRTNSHSVPYIALDCASACF